MVLTRPVTKTIISTTDFGQPVYDWIVANTPTPWVAMTYKNGWGTYPGYQPLQYRKIGDVVYLRGFVQSPGTASVIATLPVGMRPPYTLEYAAAYWNGSARVVIAIAVFNSGDINSSDAAGSGSGIGLNFAWSIT